MGMPGDPAQGKPLTGEWHTFIKANQKYIKQRKEIWKAPAQDALFKSGTETS